MSTSTHVAIVGGGLVGISLAVALRERNVPFTLYEARGSFTEIGAGIGLNVAGMRALRLIKPSVGERVLELADRNPPHEQNLYMDVRYGAASGQHREGDSICKFYSPPTGTLTFHRQTLLALLAEEMGAEHARFNKKLVEYEQNEDGVTLKFADGTEETASVLIACDGIHSNVRSIMYGRSNIVSRPHYNHDGGYRAVLPMDKVTKALGESAKQMQIFLGPNGALTTYPVSGGASVNVMAWSRRVLPPEGNDWTISSDKEQIKGAFADWGETMHNVIDCFDEKDTKWWSAYQFAHQPDIFHKKRVLLIGDAAHAMPPHQGAGAAEGIVDAYILSEVLAKSVCALSSSSFSGADSKRRTMLEAAVRATDEVRRPRFLQVQKYSTEAGRRWHHFHSERLEGPALDTWIQIARERLDFIWEVDLTAEAEKARIRYDELVATSIVTG